MINRILIVGKTPLASSKKHGQQSIVRYFKDQKCVTSKDTSKIRASASETSVLVSAITPEPSIGSIHPALSPPNPAAAATKRKPKPCPAYKVVENTRFAVDAFQFGDIDGVDHYFLTHFHADHYVGLRKSFAHPLHVSRITGVSPFYPKTTAGFLLHLYSDCSWVARLVMEFISIDKKYIHEHDINLPFLVDDVGVTLLDANQ